MYCGNCGNQIPDDAKFCPKCGTLTQEKASYVQPEEKYSKIENSKKHKAEGRNTDKTKTDIMPILIVGVGALIVVLGVICFILFTNGKKDKEDTKQAAQAQEQQTEEAEEAKPEETKPEEEPEEVQEEAQPAADEAPESQESVTGQEEPKEYILVNSSASLLTQADMDGLSAEELRLAINEIYARHGRKFKDQELQNYFNARGWYHGAIEPDAFDESLLSDIEKQNVQLLSARKDAAGTASASSNTGGVNYVSAYAGLVARAASVPNNISWYWLWDMDEDGILELIINEKTCEADALIRIYTYDGSNAIQLGEQPGGHGGACYIDGTTGLVLEYAHMGYEWVNLINKNGNSITVTKLLDHEVGVGDEIGTTLPRNELYGCDVNSQALLAGGVPY